MDLSQVLQYVPFRVREQLEFATTGEKAHHV